MDHLFLVRHGDYTQTKRLSAVGERQIQKLAEQIKAADANLRNGFTVVSSPSLRAMQSAQIIAREFGLDSIAKHCVLFSEGEDPLSPEKLEDIDLVVGRYMQNHGVAVVSHWDVVYHYSRYFCERELGMGCGGIREPEKGEAVHFDLRRKRYEMLPK